MANQVHTRIQQYTFFNTQTFFFGKCYVLFPPVPHNFYFINTSVATRIIAINHIIYLPDSTTWSRSHVYKSANNKKHLKSVKSIWSTNVKSEQFLGVKLERNGCLTGLCNWLSIPVLGAQSWKHSKNSTSITSVPPTLGSSSSEASAVSFFVSLPNHGKWTEQILFFVARSMQEISNTNKRLAAP